MKKMNAAAQPNPMATITFTLICFGSLMAVSVGAESKLNRLSVHSQKLKNLRIFKSRT